MALELRVVGMGNILFRDEGVGVYAAHALRRCFSFDPEIVIEDGGLAGFNIMHMIFDPASVIVLDALSTDAPAGKPVLFRKLSTTGFIAGFPAAYPTIILARGPTSTRFPS